MIPVIEIDPQVLHMAIPSSNALSALLLAGALGVLPGCAVVTVAGAAAGAAIEVTGAVVSTAVSVTGKVVGKTIDAVTPGDGDKAAAPKK